MKYKNVFQRHEMKYRITKEQKDNIVKQIEPYMKIDMYGHTTIRNLYFDTDTYLLIRRSIEKPVYKEKIRIRSYKKVNDTEDVFVELKKKYKGIVFKRRIALKEKEAMNWICKKAICPKNTQIGKEIDYFINHYDTLHPTLFLSYEREAYYCENNENLRITFDENVMCRENRLSLQDDADGISILDKDCILMEIKCVGAMPVWLSNLLSKEHIYKTSFSKYGTAYRTIIFPKLKEDSNNGNNI